MNKAITRPAKVRKAPENTPIVPEKSAASAFQAVEPQAIESPKPQKCPQSKNPAPQSIDSQAVEPSRAENPRTQYQAIQYQAIACIPGHLTVADERLYLRCPDDALLPIVGIDSKLSVWLMARPAVMFSTEVGSWIVYPKADRKTGDLALFLKGRVNPDSPKPFKLPADSAVIKGKLLSRDGDRLTIGIRRNLSTNAFKELARKQMIQGSEFDQFTVPVWGTVGAEVGSIVDLTCKRDGDRLVIL